MTEPETPEDPLWRRLDEQDPHDVLRRLQQGVYGRANEASVRRWLVERGGDPDGAGKRRVLKDRIKWIIQILLSS